VSEGEEQRGDMNRIVPGRLSRSGPSASALFCRPKFPGLGAYRLHRMEARHALALPTPLTAVLIQTCSFWRAATPFPARGSCPEPSGWQPAAAPCGLQSTHSLFHFTSRCSVWRAGAGDGQHRPSLPLSPRARRRASLFKDRRRSRTLKVAHRRERITTACSRRRRGRRCWIQRRRGAAAADAER
jgi:hypothetical protein